MTFPFIHLILAGLMGIRCQIVSKVSVRKGDSITIPCLYPKHYRDSVKYLCKGYYSISCSSAVTTDTGSSGRFLISDEKSESLFTVTINDLNDKDKHYWCAVEKKGLDNKQYFELTVTGNPSLYVDQQEVKAFEGGSVTVMCHSEYDTLIKWCKLGITCVADRTGSIGGATVTIEASVSFFNVTMSELKTESSGWYWCDQNGFQTPVHLTVYGLTTSTAETTTISTTKNFTETLPATTASESSSAPPTNFTVNQTVGPGPQDEPKSSTKMLILIVIPVLLLLFVPAAFFGWRMVTHGKTQPDVPPGSQTGSDPDVHYATIHHNQQVAAQKKNSMQEDSVTYSTIVMKDRAAQMAEPADG